MSDRPVVLLVEDNPLTRKMLRVVLDKSGYQALEAETASEALDVAQRHRLHLVLQDLHLPDLDGIALVRALRQLPYCGEIPIIAMSGLLSKIEEARTLRAGFTDYLFKPVETARLLSLLDSHLRPRMPFGRFGEARRLLLVDDDPVQIRLNALQLRGLGFEVTTAAGGPEALDLMAQEVPDIVVTDLLMPDMTGFELCLAMRRQSRLATIPVVVASTTFAIIEEADRALAHRIGVTAFVERTPSLDEVIAAVRGSLDIVPPAIPAIETEGLTTAFTHRLIHQLEHQIALNASLARQTGMHAAQLSILEGAAQVLTQEHDLPTVLEAVLMRALDAGGVSAGAIFLLDDDERPVLRAQIGFPDTLRDELADFFGQRPLLRALMQEDRPIEIPSSHVDPLDAQRLLGRAGVNALIVAPLLAGGRSHGALVLRASSREFGDTFLGSVAAVAGQLGQATALSRVVERLATSEFRYRSLFEGVPTGVFRSEPGGRLLDVNHELVRLLGAPDAHSLLGRSAFSHYADPKDRDRWQAELDRQGEVRDFETRILRRDGTSIPISISARAIRGLDGAIQYYEGTLTDISLRKATEAALQDTQARLQHVLASSVAVIYLLRITPEGAIPEWVSDNLLRVTGHDPASTLTPSWWLEHVHPDDSDRAMMVVRTLQETEEATHEYRFERKDGTYLWLRDSMRLLRDEHGTPVQVVGAWLDITEQKSLEAQFLQAQKMEAIGQLAAGVAHDFNNILTVISGYAELLRDHGGDAASTRAGLTEIVQASRRAALLTRQLLAFGRRQLLQPVTIDLNAAVQQAMTMVTRLIGQHITVRETFSAMALPVRLDPGQFEQVLLNLAVNARDAMERGGELLIRTWPMECSIADARDRGLDHPGRYAVLQVMDNGGGIPPDVVARIFEPFFTTKERGKGTGLGLSTVYGIVRQSGGHIAVDSEPGVGTTFTLHFPMATGVVPGDEDGAAPSEPPAGRGEMVLVVEDESALRQFAVQVLRRHGYRTIEAPNAAEALAFILRTDALPELVLTDVSMPGMTGPELGQRLRELAPDIAVMYMSGYAGDAAQRLGVPLQPGSFLNKPFSADELLEAVAARLAPRRAATPS